MITIHAKPVFVLCLIICCLKLTISVTAEIQEKEENYMKPDRLGLVWDKIATADNPNTTLHDRPTAPVSDESGTSEEADVSWEMEHNIMDSMAMTGIEGMAHNDVDNTRGVGKTGVYYKDDETDAPARKKMRLI